MNRIGGVFLALVGIAVLTTTVVAQESFPPREVPPLLLVRIMVMMRRLQPSARSMQ